MLLIGLLSWLAELAFVAGFSLSNYIKILVQQEACDWTGKREAELSRGRWISEFEASLFYKVSSRTVRAIQRNPVSTPPQKRRL